MQQIDLIVLVGIVLFLLGMPFILLRCVKDMYHHEGSMGPGSRGVMGAIAEMDRIVNPAGAHVTEAKEVETREEEIGGD